MRIVLSCLLCGALAGNPLWGQASGPSSPSRSSSFSSSAVVESLHLRLIDSPGPVGPRSTSKGYVFQVTNASGAPVAGAAVALRLPAEGTTGLFGNGLRAWVSYTDEAGIARFPVIEWGGSAGQLEIKVTAAKGTVHTGIVVAQNITEPVDTVVSVVSVPVARPPAAGDSPKQQASGQLTADVSQDRVVPKPAPPRAPVVNVDTLPPAPALADTVPLNLPNLAAEQVPPGPPPATPAQAKEDQNKMNVAHSGVSKLSPNPPAPEEPTVSIVNTPTGASGESHKKVWVLLAVGAGVGVGAILGVMAVHGNGNSSGGSTAGVVIGNPVISVGH